MGRRNGTKALKKRERRSRIEHRGQHKRCEKCIRYRWAEEGACLNCGETAKDWYESLCYHCSMKLSGY